MSFGFGYVAPPTQDQSVPVQHNAGIAAGIGTSAALGGLLTAGALGYQGFVMGNVPGAVIGSLVGLGLGTATTVSQVQAYYQSPQEPTSADVSQEISGNLMNGIFMGSMMMGGFGQKATGDTASRFNAARGMGTQTEEAPAPPTMGRGAGSSGSSSGFASGAGAGEGQTRRGTFAAAPPVPQGRLNPARAVAHADLYPLPPDDHEGGEAPSASQLPAFSVGSREPLTAVRPPPLPRANATGSALENSEIGGGLGRFRMAMQQAGARAAARAKTGMGRFGGLIKTGVGKLSTGKKSHQGLGLRQFGLQPAFNPTREADATLARLQRLQEQGVARLEAARVADSAPADALTRISQMAGGTELRDFLAGDHEGMAHEQDTTMGELPRARSDETAAEGDGEELTRVEGRRTAVGDERGDQFMGITSDDQVMFIGDEAGFQQHEAGIHPDQIRAKSAALETERLRQQAMQRERSGRIAFASHRERLRDALRREAQPEELRKARQSLSLSTPKGEVLSQFLKRRSPEEQKAMYDQLEPSEKQFLEMVDPTYWPSMKDHMAAMAEAQGTGHAPAIRTTTTRTKTSRPFSFFKTPIGKSIQVKLQYQRETAMAIERNQREYETFKQEAWEKSQRLRKLLPGKRARSGAPP